MAMSETISSTGPGEYTWAQFYQQYNNSGQAVAPSGRTTAATMFNTDQASSDATAVTTTVSSSSGAGAGHDDHEYLNLQQGGDAGRRVSKPIRRQRSRASRRTPTTLLNTDTNNFRAMVQQFTGAPFPTPITGGSPHHHPAAGGAAANFNFVLGSGSGTPTQQIVNPSSSSVVMVPSAGAYHHLQFHHYHYHQQRHQQYQEQQIQQYMFPAVNSSSTSRSSSHGLTTGGDAFLQRLSSSNSNSRPTIMELNNVPATASGFVMDMDMEMEGISSHAPPRPPSSNHNNNNRNANSNNYTF